MEKLRIEREGTRRRKVTPAVTCVSGLWIRTSNGKKKWCVEREKTQLNSDLVLSSVSWVMTIDCFSSFLLAGVFPWLWGHDLNAWAIFFLEIRWTNKRSMEFHRSGSKPLNNSFRNFSRYTIKRLENYNCSCSLRPVDTHVVPLERTKDTRAKNSPLIWFMRSIFFDADFHVISRRFLSLTFQGNKSYYNWNKEKKLLMVTETFFVRSRRCKIQSRRRATFNLLDESHDSRTNIRIHLRVARVARSKGKREKSSTVRAGRRQD